MSSPLSDRIAGAPISWGVCEVPGWGYQLEPETVLAQMAELGLAATEFGPDGFLPDAPQDKAQTLRAHGLQAVGQFVPVVLHDPDHDPLPEVATGMEALVAAGASTVVLAAATGHEGYDERPQLDDAGWATLLANLDLLRDAARAQGLTATLHPHVGTMVETGEETARVLAGSSIGLCLDTGHLLIGGTDPAELTRQAPERIAHTHMKDVDASLAAKVQDGQLSYTDAVRKVYRPLGAGDVDVEAIVTHLSARGYDGWYVLEQDTILTEEPKAKGPVEDVWASAEHLRSVLRGVA
jgi:inosose dehydratase